MLSSCKSQKHAKNNIQTFIRIFLLDEGQINVRDDVYREAENGPRLQLSNR